MTKGQKMRTRLGFAVIVILASVSLFAADAPKNAVSFSFTNSSSTIGYRRSFGAFAALVNAGYSKLSFSESEGDGTHGTAELHAWTLGAGLRRYLATKNALHVFAQADVSRSIAAPYAVIGGVSECDKLRQTSGSLSGGVEYHVSRNVSLEGTAGVSAGEAVSRCTSSSFSDLSTTRSIGTFRSALTLNFYF